MTKTSERDIVTLILIPSSYVSVWVYSVGHSVCPPSAHHLGELSGDLPLQAHHHQVGEEQDRAGNVSSSCGGE